MLKRVVDRIIDYLADMGVTDLFTVSGGGSIFLNDALAKSQRINYYCCHHEQAVAMSTEAYARVKETLGVSVVTTGPGGTNAITGVAGSWIDSVPHLILSGQVFLSQTIGDSGLRQLGVQELNIIDLVKPVTKYAVMVKKPEETLYHIQKAIHMATTGRPGPVWVDIPADIQNARLPEKAFEMFEPVALPISVNDIRKEVGEVAAFLRTSKRPLIHIGQGVQLAGAYDEFIKLVEKHKIPFVTARNANQLVDGDHELYAGRPGTFAQRGANFAVQNADIYLAVGTRLTLTQTGYNSKDYARNATRIMVDIDDAELNKHTLDLHVKIRSDAKAFFLELNKQLHDARLETTGWVSQCRSWHTRYPIVLPEHRERKAPVNSYYFIEVLSELLDEHDVVVTDMGLAFQCTHQAFKIKRGQQLITNSGYASMGWGLPAAIGACVARNKGRVVCIAGDGGLQMTIQELATVMHHNFPVKLFVFNNGGYLTIKQTQEIGFEGRLMGCNEDSGLSFPDFVKVAEAYQLKGVQISSQEGLKEKMTEILDSEAPVVCDLVMDPDQPQIPKAIPWKLPDGTTGRTVFEDMYPFLDREELRENMIAENEGD